VKSLLKSRREVWREVFEILSKVREIDTLCVVAHGYPSLGLSGDADDACVAVGDGEGYS